MISPFVTENIMIFKKQENNLLAKIYNRKVKISFSANQKLITILFAVVFLLLFVFFVSFSHNNKFQKELFDATSYGKSISSGLLLSIDQTIISTQVIKKLAVDFNKEFNNRYNTICANFAIHNPNILGFGYAPDGIVTKVYPPEFSSDFVGLNVFEYESEKAFAENSKVSHEITVSGPREIPGGYEGFIIRNPYFENGEFKFFIYAFIDWKSYISGISIIANETNKHFNIGIWKDETEDVITDPYGFIINTSNKNLSRIVDIEIPVANEIWHLCVEPVEGWGHSILLISETIIAAIFFLFLWILIFIRQYESACKFYEFEHDALTGLYTRSAFYRRVRKLFKDNPDENLCIIVSDIENFKVLNSVYGAKECDNLLCYFADRFQKLIKNSISARYGGDLFVTIYKYSDILETDDFVKNTKKILEDSPIPNVVVKYGVYNNVDKSISPSLICDRALLAAKSILHTFEQNIANYDGPVSNKHLREQIFESTFKDAIKNKNFQIWYQPKFDAKTEKLIGAEALVRWKKPDGTVISPADFIYVFENDGLIIELDKYVFQSVCSTIKELMSRGIPVVPISVNLSRASLRHASLIEDYKEIVQEYDIPIELIPLEITETTSFSNKEIKGLTLELKNAGFRIDMDDFGTGASSLASLNIIPFDVLKIDKSLIDFIGTPDGNELIKHSIELAHFKNIHVVAEGVENLEQLTFLRKLGCDSIQGYYYSPPLNHDDCMKLFESFEPNYSL